MSIDKKNENPIGVFDSGVGGISVLRELVKIMPNENYLYFGDSINAPYGTKEVSVIRELTIKNIECRSKSAQADVSRDTACRYRTGNKTRR